MLMAGRFGNPVKIAAAKVLLLFAIFFLIACGLGYPVLNRFDPRLTPGLSDVKIYAAMVTGDVGAEAGHVRFRVLVPCVAKPFYRLARGKFASWDPVIFGLLMADSLFVAGTCVLIVVLGGGQLGNPAAGLVGSLLYLVNFAVPNLRLVGLVDAGEGFFLLALIWSLSELELWAFPVIAVCGALAKETFIPFSVALTFAWWVVVRRDLRNHGKDGALPALAWIAASWLVGLIVMVGLQWSVSGSFDSPLRFGLDLHRGHDYAGHFIKSLYDRNLWYVFVWLLPTAIPNLKRLPKSWLVPVGATSVLAFVLDAYYGGAPGTVGRALFSVVGPVLSLSSALFVLRITAWETNV